MQATKDPKGQDRVQGAGQRPQPAQAGPVVIVTDDDETSDPVTESAYLKSAGWSKVSSRETPNPKKRWLDPHSGKPSRRVLTVPEVRDASGRVATAAVYQVLTGSSPWFYSRVEAVQVQRDRDEAAKTKGHK
jgi:hypothetical protein